MVPAVQRNRIDAMYFDLSKAFNTVAHSLLLHKLDCNVQTHLMLSEGYLSDRTNVRVLGWFCGQFRSTYGVPQGSNFGPLLVVQHLEMLLFADDIKTFALSYSMTLLLSHCGVHQMGFIKCDLIPSPTGAN